MQAASLWTQIQPTVVEVLQYLIPALGAAALAKLGHVMHRRKVRERDSLRPEEPFDLSPSSSPPPLPPKRSKRTDPRG